MSINIQYRSEWVTGIEKANERLKRKMGKSFFSQNIIGELGVNISF